MYKGVQSLACGSSKPTHVRKRVNIDRPGCDRCVAGAAPPVGPAGPSRGRRRARAAAGECSSRTCSVHHTGCN
eukprot:2012164-Prymnesium_polylepis.1